MGERLEKVKSQIYHMTDFLDKGDAVNKAQAAAGLAEKMSHRSDFIRTAPLLVGAGLKGIKDISRSFAEGRQFDAIEFFAGYPIGESGVGSITELKKSSPLDFESALLRIIAKSELKPTGRNKITVSTYEMIGVLGNTANFAIASEITERNIPTGRSWAVFGSKEIQSDQGKVEVLVPPALDNFSVLVPLKAVDSVPDDNKFEFGAIDPNDPESIWPLFVIETETDKEIGVTTPKAVKFLPPYAASSIGEIDAPSGVAKLARLAKPKEEEIVEVESDLRPNHIETVSKEFLGVDITLNLITDKSLDPVITEVRVNDHFTNKDGKNAEDSLMEFTARVFYKTWLANGGVDGKGPETEVTFEEYMKMWSEAQNGQRPWEDVQITIMANQMKQEGEYNPEKTIIWPMFEGETPTGVRAISEFNIAFVKSSRVDNITIVEENYNIGLGANINAHKIYMYLGLSGNKESSHVGNVLPAMSSSPNWMTYQKAAEDEELVSIIGTRANTPNKSIYSAAIQVFPQNAIERQYNP